MTHERMLNTGRPTAFFPWHLFYFLAHWWAITLIPRLYRRLPLALRAQIYSVNVYQHHLLITSYELCFSLLSPLSLALSFFFFCHVLSMQKFPGQGSHLSRSSDNVVSLTAWPPGNSSPCDSCSDLLVASHVCHECSVLLATPGPLSSCLVLGTWLGSQPPADLPSLPPTTVAAPVDTWTGSCSIIGGGSEEPRVWESSSCLLPWRLETRPAFLRVHGCSPCCSAKNNGAVGNGLWSWTWSFWGRMISRSLVFFVSSTLFHL